jgi:DNA-binding NtrC family response regulator
MPARLLIVDDDPALLTGLSDGLSARLPDISPKTASSAKEALGLMATEEFDVILSDVVMPGMSGLEFLARVRKLCPGTAIILMTGCQDELRHEALRLGAVDFLTKPFTMDGVVSILRRALEQASLLRRLHETNRLSELARQEKRT